MKNKRLSRGKPTPAAIRLPGWAYHWRIYDPSDPLQYTRHRQMFRNYLSRLPVSPDFEPDPLNRKLNNLIKQMKSQRKVKA